jgi:hypothetical protein
MPTTILLWVQAFLTLALFSIVFADNGFYKLSEHLYVGLYAGYTVVVTWFNYIRPSSQDMIAKQKYHLVIPIVLGLLIYTRYIKGLQWLARYNMAFVVGVGSGLVLARDFKALLLDQVTATFKPLWVAGKLGRHAQQPDHRPRSGIGPVVLPVHGQEGRRPGAHQQYRTHRHDGRVRLGLRQHGHVARQPLPGQDAVPAR